MKTKLYFAFIILIIVIALLFAFCGFDKITTASKFEESGTKSKQATYTLADEPAA